MGGYHSFFKAVLDLRGFLYNSFTKSLLVSVLDCFLSGLKCCCFLCCVVSVAVFFCCLVGDLLLVCFGNEMLFLDTRRKGRGKKKKKKKKKKTNREKQTQKKTKTTM